MRKEQRLPLEVLAPYLVPGPAPLGPPSQEPAPPLDWRTLFGNEHPVEIEVGFGKGLFLVTAGQANPDINYLGIEIVRKYQLFTANRIARRGLNNVRLACADARSFLPQRVAEQSVQAIHVYFPDPWWKKRHHKRRLFTLDFARQCLRVLRPGGMFLIATDVADYAEMVRATVTECGGFVELPPPPEKPAEHDMDYLTNFERKFRLQGKTIYRMRYQRAVAEGK